MQEEFIIDAGGDSFSLSLRVDREIVSCRSEYQSIRVIYNADFGRVLVLDGAIQITERDDFIYSEMLGHVPLIVHRAPERVLIIGGGDGGILKEVLRHSLTNATLVEIDGMVVDVVKKHCPSIPCAAFDDPRTRLLIEDGIKFVNDTNEKFDVCLIDSTDPVGPAIGLFTSEFYSRIAQLLGSEGVLDVQSGSPIYQRDLMDQVSQNLIAAGFKYVRRYVSCIPSYPGCLWSFTIATNSRDPAKIDEEEIAARLQAIGGTKWYVASSHKHIFSHPELPKAPLNN
jgi:spermidine synthase